MHKCARCTRLSIVCRGSGNFDDGFFSCRTGSLRGSQFQLAVCVVPAFWPLVGRFGVQGLPCFLHG